MNPREFVAWESSTRDTLDFKRIYVDMTGDLAAGLMLSQLVYWHLPTSVGASKLRIKKGGHLWVAKRWDQWWAEVRLTEKQAVRAGEILLDLGVVAKRVYRFHSERTVHLRLEWETFLALWKATLERPEDERNAGPGTRTKRPKLPRRPKAPNGSRRALATAEATTPWKSENAGREFSKTPNEDFTKRPHGVTENAHRALPITESFSKTLTEGGGQDVTPAARPQSESTVPVARPEPTAHSSSGDALLEHHDEPDPPGVAVLDPPVGGAADAAVEGPRLSLEELQHMFDDPPKRPPGLEKVPGGRAPESVADLAPIPRAELLARPLAAEDGEVYGALREVLGSSLTTLLGERTRTAQLARGEYWPRLTGAEVHEVTAVARAEARRTAGHTITLAVRGLDRRIGAVAAARTREVGHAQASRATPAVVGPVDLSHLDPGLEVGQRCTVGDDLGVVYDVSNIGYLVDLDIGNRVTVDRAEAVQLRRLRPSDEPLLQTPRLEQDRVVTLADVGSQWRPRGGGNVVTVLEVKGASRVLNDGSRLPVFVLILKSERV